MKSIKEEILKEVKKGHLKNPDDNPVCEVCIKEAIDLTLKKQQEKFLKLIKAEKYGVSRAYSINNNPIYLDWLKSLEGLKQKVKGQDVK